MSRWFMALRSQGVEAKSNVDAIRDAVCRHV
jgi:hypothetical protein